VGSDIETIGVTPQREREHQGEMLVIDPVAPDFLVEQLDTTITEAA
jgi:hypothetical protein